MQLVCLSRTQDGNSADSKGITTVSDGLTHGERRRASEDSTIKTYTNTGMAAEQVRRCKSEDIDSSRSCLLTGKKSAHLIAAEEQEILQGPMDGNFTALGSRSL